MKQLYVSGCILGFPEIIFVSYPSIPSVLSQGYIEILEIDKMLWYTRIWLICNESFWEEISRSFDVGIKQKCI